MSDESREYRIKPEHIIKLKKYVEKLNKEINKENTNDKH